jgi:hypothetical protein
MHARIVWGIFALPLLATVVTYWRLAPGATYNFDDTGAHGAASRVVTYLNFPVAIAAIALLLIYCHGRWAWLAGLLCLVAFLPGVVSQDDLSASWVNAPATIGVLLAVPLTLAANPGRDAPLSMLRKLLLVVCLIWAVPWIIASLGLYAQDVPLLGDVIRARQPTPGEPGLASVHRGLHEGLFGAQLAASALILSSRLRLRTASSLYLSLMFVYGVMVSAQDGWHEQVVKRGWTDASIPNVLTPKPTVAWGCVLVAALLVHWFWFRRGAGRY